MKVSAFSSLLLLAVCVPTWCAREEDLVTHLPGLEVQPTFKHYAGYLDATLGKKLFYWFIESENDPATDPVVLWLNGGPGCSSLTGLLLELGPWRVNEDGTGLYWFEERWTKIANILFLESPTGVGYSYDEEGDNTADDDSTAFHNHQALKDFFKYFPEYMSNDFYVTGESYAGVYVPTLSVLVMDDPSFNFKGFAVGNGITDKKLMSNALVYFTAARGIYGSDLRNDLLRECCNNGNSSDCNFYNDLSTECRRAVVLVNKRVWADGLNPYNLYQLCDGGAIDSSGLIHGKDNVLRLAVPDSVPIVGQEPYNQYQQFYRHMAESFPSMESSAPCTDATNRETYLNTPEVREALHVPEYVHQWNFCSTIPYTQLYENLRAEYLRVLEQGHRVLVYSGDLDMACDHLGSQAFVESLGWQQALDQYHPWYFTAEDETIQIGGFALNYPNLAFNTIKGSGHFVPTDAPIPAYTMWEKFVNNTLM